MFPNYYGIDILFQSRRSDDFWPAVIAAFNDDIDFIVCEMAVFPRRPVFRFKEPACFGLPAYPLRVSLTI